MKHAKIFGFLLVVAASLTVFAGSASGTTITTDEGSTPNFRMTSTNSKLDGAFVAVECAHSEIEAGIESHGFGTPVAGAVDKFSFSGCNYSVTVNKKGSLDIHAIAGSGGDGTVTSTGAEITIHTSVGTCVFTTPVGALGGTDIGRIEGGSFSFMSLNSAKIPRTGGNFLCGSSGTWTGSYTIWSPHELQVH